MNLFSVLKLNCELLLQQWLEVIYVTHFLCSFILLLNYFGYLERSVFFFCWLQYLNPIFLLFYHLVSQLVSSHSQLLLLQQSSFFYFFLYLFLYKLHYFYFARIHKIYILFFHLCCYLCFSLRSIIKYI